MSVKFIGIVLLTLLASCNTKVKQEDVEHLAGYWEIEFVKLPDGTRKDYTVNETIDHIAMTGNNGVRQKLMPQFDGTYRTSGDTEKIAIDLSDSHSIIKYSTPYAKWTEEILKLSLDELVLKSNNLEYHYKRPTPFTLKQ